MSDNLLSFIEFLNYCDGKTPEDKLENMAKHEVKSNRALSISYKKEMVDSQYPLYILNYNQIKSPSFDPWVVECRSLVLGINKNNKFYVVARSYSRFPDCFEDKNAADKILETLPLKKNTKFHRIAEKKDGSIMMLFWHDQSNKWLRMSRSTLGHGRIGWLDITFGELFDKLITLDIKELDQSYNYIFEIYQPGGNHIITRYDEPYLCLLDARKIPGEYASAKEMDALAVKLKVQRPKILLENATVNEVKTYLQEMRKTNPLFEGAVAIYEFSNGMRIMLKIKDSWYYTFHANMHKERGPNLTIPDVTIRLHIVNHLNKEMLAQMSTDDERANINLIIDEYNKLFDEMKSMCKLAVEIKNQKKFAEIINNHPLKNIIFTARRTTPNAILDEVERQWYNQTEKVIDVINSRLKFRI